MCATVSGKHGFCWGSGRILIRFWSIVCQTMILSPRPRTLATLMCGCLFTLVLVICQIWAGIEVFTLGKGSSCLSGNQRRWFWQWRGGLSSITKKNTVDMTWEGIRSEGGIRDKYLRNYFQWHRIYMFSCSPDADAIAELVGLYGLQHACRIRQTQSG